jgi:hypothetical protein
VNGHLVVSSILSSCRRGMLSGCLQFTQGDIIR